MSFEIPILLLVFNRPEKVKQVFELVRKVKPKQLFVAADGPRSDHPEDPENCYETRRIIDAVDWECEIVTLFREQNLGCRESVSSAITWFFTLVEEGIILEDDCVPSESFFSYCRELLKYYRDDERVMVVSGDNYQDGHTVTNDSYYFSRYPHCWGWATWRRAWEKYDARMSAWPTCKSGGFLSSMSGKDKLFVAYWRNIFDKVHAGEIDSWAYVWTFSCWASGGLTALPTKNLVKNVGFDMDATHTVNVNEKIEAMQAYDLSWPLAHPTNVVRNVDADFYTDMYHFGIGPERGVPLVHRAISSVMTPLRRMLARFQVNI